MPPTARFLDIHVIQTVPYANLNRDDTNAVKTVQYGGEERTRVSSQSWKRATHPALHRLLGEQAVRTRRIGERLARFLRDEGWPADLAGRAGQHLTVGSGIKAEPPKKNADLAEDKDWTLNAMVYIPDSAITEFAALAEAHRADLETSGEVKKAADAVLPTKQIQDILRARNGIISLYGRMLAEVDGAGVDGAVQVAHAFTTHATAVEVDYFAAVDDLTEQWRQTGSAHIGDAEFSAGTFYRYATVDIADLLHNIGGTTETAAKSAAELAGAFTEAFVVSIPRAKKTATAPHTIPELVHVSVRADRPVSFAAAFEQPVRPGRDGGYAIPSVDALSAYAEQVATFLGGTASIYRGHAGTATISGDSLGKRVPALGELISAALQHALGR